MPLKTLSVNIHNIFLINKTQSPSNGLHLRNKKTEQHSKEYYSALKRKAQHWGKDDYGRHDADCAAADLSHPRCKPIMALLLKREKSRDQEWCVRNCGWRRETAQGC